jgi:hypothetical protein
LVFLVLQRGVHLEQFKHNMFRPLAHCTARMLRTLVHLQQFKHNAFCRPSHRNNTMFTTNTGKNNYYRSYFTLYMYSHKPLTLLCWLTYAVGYSTTKASSHLLTD